MIKTRHKNKSKNKNLKKSSSKERQRKNALKKKSKWKKKVEESSNVPMATLQIDSDFTRFYKDEDKRDLNQEEYQKAYLDSKIQFPYGSHFDYDPSFWDKYTRLYPKNTEKKELPVFGPPQETQIWSKPEDFGTDYQLRPALNQPLPQKQMDWLSKKTQSFDNWSEDKAICKYRNINFGEIIGFGEDGDVYRAIAMDKNGHSVRLACKVIRLKPLPPNEGENEHKDEADDQIAEDEGYSEPEEPALSWSSVRKFMHSDMLSLRYIKHHNIVPMLDFVTIPDQRTGFPFSRVLLFMDLCDGDLGKLLDKHYSSKPHLSEKMCKHFFRHIVRAVEYIHERNIIHGDPHSGNILYVKDPKDANQDITDAVVQRMTFKLSDFGDSKLFPQTCDVRQLKEGKEDDINQLADDLIYSKIKNDDDYQDIFDAFVECEASNDMFDLIQQMMVRKITIKQVKKHRWLTGKDR